LLNLYCLSNKNSIVINNIEKVPYENTYTRIWYLSCKYWLCTFFKINICIYNTLNRREIKKRMY